MFYVSALLLDDALKPATPLAHWHNETLRQFAPLSDDHMLQLVDCRESLTLIGRLLKGTPNSAIGWIQVRAVWGPHFRLDERDVLTRSLIVPLVSGVASLKCVVQQQADTLII